MRRRSGLAAELVLRNGRVLTMGSDDSTARAVAVRAGAIVAVGDDADVLGLADPATQVIDLDGRVALPGLVDCHVHLAMEAGQSAGAVECRDLFDPAVRSIHDITDRIREWAQSSPPGQTILANGSPLQDFRLAERRLPTRAELDAAAPDHPVSISFGAHVVIGNSRAIEAAGVTAATPDPRGGAIVKDPVTGQPTGVFLERAQFLLRSHQSALSPEELAERILLELEKASRRGVTGVHDIVTTKEEILAYQLLARQGRLPVRVQMIVRVIESRFDKQSLLNLGFVQGFGSDWLSIGGIKMSIDGGFTGKNAAFREPINDPDGHSLIRIAQDELDETIEAYHAMGMRICTHAIGDVAMDMALDAYEKALAKHPRDDHRHRVEHLGNWMMSPERVARARALGLLPVPNPPFLHFMPDSLVAMLGTRATEQGFPFRTLWDAGFPLIFGSDAPLYYPVDPLRDLGAAVAHRGRRNGLPVNEREALTVAEALRAQTANAAFAGFRETSLGTIAVGKLADLTVLDRDPFSFPPDRFDELPIALTVAGGRIVHQAGAGVPARPPSSLTNR